MQRDAILILMQTSGLCGALKRQCIDSLRRLIARGVTGNTVSPWSTSGMGGPAPAYAVAAEMGWLEGLAVLLPTTDRPGAACRRAMHLAPDAALPVVRAILACAPDADRDSVLHAGLVSAARHGAVETIRFLLDEGAQLDNPRANRTVLFCALDFDTTRVLLAAGAAPNGAWHVPPRFRPIVGAARIGPDSMRILLHAGAALDPETTPWAIREAVAYLNIESLKLIEARGGNLAPALSPALDHASRLRDATACAALLNLGAGETERGQRIMDTLARRRPRFAKEVAEIAAQ